MNQADALIENAYLDLRPKLLAYFSRGVKERAVAEDLVHDVFVRAQTHADQLRRPEQFEGWIFGIARNALLDWRRRRRVTSEVGPDLPAPVPDDPPLDLSASVRWFISQLPMLYRAPLVLVELRGLSVKEAAARLEISYTAAKSRVRRAPSPVKPAAADRPPNPAKPTVADRSRDPAISATSAEFSDRFPQSWHEPGFTIRHRRRAAG